MKTKIISIRTVLGNERVFTVNGACPVTNKVISSIIFYDRWAYRMYDADDNLISEVVNTPCIIVYGHE
jgi:hypothetical protein